MKEYEIQLIFVVFRVICQLFENGSHGVLSLLDEPHVHGDLAYQTRIEQCCAGHSHCLAGDVTLPSSSFQ